jgi:hypothetical protein
MGIANIQAFNASDMSLLSSDVTESGLDFGAIIRGGHCAYPAVIQPVITGAISDLYLFLQSNGGFNNAQFGYLVSPFPYSDVQAGGPQMSDHFVVVSDVSDLPTSDFSDNGVSLDPTGLDFIWLDAQVGYGSQLGEGSINYLFAFEFN